MTNPAQIAARAHKARLDKTTTSDPAARTLTAQDAPVDPPAGTQHQPMPPSQHTRLCPTCFKNGQRVEATLVTPTGHAACPAHADELQARRQP